MVPSCEKREGLEGLRQDHTGTNIKRWKTQMETKGRAIDLGRKQESMLPLKLNSKSNPNFSTFSSS